MTDCPFGSDQRAFEMLSEMQSGIAVIKTELGHVSKLTEQAADRADVNDDRSRDALSIAERALEIAKIADARSAATDARLDEYRRWLVRSTIGGVFGALVIIGQGAWNWTAGHINVNWK